MIRVMRKLESHVDGTSGESDNDRSLLAKFLAAFASYDVLPKIFESFFTAIDSP